MGDGAEEDNNVLSLINFDYDCEELELELFGGGPSSWLGEIEEILFKDDDDEYPSDPPPPLDFFADLEIPLGVGVNNNDDYLIVLPQDDGGPTTNQSSPDNNKTNNNNQLVNESDSPESNISSSEGEDPPNANDAAADDDPITKKRKRQIRNRDAAVRSRERKKMYVKDLEVKSRYLEGECIRLQRLLHCCASENHALHLQLQKEKAITASRTKQESAVLFLESLLLGSLLWFLGILGLFPPLELDSLQPPARMLVNVGTNSQEVVALGRAKSKRIGLGTLRLFFKSKRCKASRSKMKTMACYGAVLA